jgi:serine/threonine protein kinase
MSELNPSLWQRLSPLLDRALDLEPTARHDLLAAVRHEDPTLAAALEDLLARHQRVLTSGFLDTPPLDGDAPPSMAGHAVGGYRLVRPLGTGGMGTVWLARRSDGRFEGSAAVKFLNLAVLDEVGHERFRREGTFLARLSHPHIARLLDAGVTGSGQPFLVLEYVEGTRIDRFAAERRLTIDARLALFQQVADAVAHAHANLVVHRDLKPSNVMVVRFGEVLVLDWGVAKVLEADGLAGTRVGTPGFMSPEQARGESATGAASDVFALGAVLFWMLTGATPDRTRDEAARHLRALPARPPVRLRAIVLKCLAEDVAERYATAGDLAADLARYRAGQPVLAHRETALEKFAHWFLKYRTFILLVAAYLVMRALFAFFR